MYASLTQELSLRSRLGPEKEYLFAESPKVIGEHTGRGLRPLSLLMERRQLEGQGRDLVKQSGQVPVYTGDRAVLARLTGYEPTPGHPVRHARPRLPLCGGCAPGPAGWRCWRGIVDPHQCGGYLPLSRRCPAYGQRRAVPPSCCDPSAAGRCGSACRHPVPDPGLFWAPTHPSGPSRGWRG